MILLLESLKFTRDEQQWKAVCLEKEYKRQLCKCNACKKRPSALGIEM